MGKRKLKKSSLDTFWWHNLTQVEIVGRRENFANLAPACVRLWILSSNCENFFELFRGWTHQISGKFIEIAWASNLVPWWKRFPCVLKMRIKKAENLFGVLMWLMSASDFDGRWSQSWLKSNCIQIKHGVDDRWKSRQSFNNSTESAWWCKSFMN